MPESEVIEIDLRRLVSVLLRRWWLLLIALCVGGAAAFAITSFVIVPQYSATVKLYVNNSTDTSSSTRTSGDISASKSLVETYITIIRSDTVLDEVLEKTGFSYTPKELNKMLTAGALNATEVFYITITSPKAREAAEIANKIAEVAPGYLEEIVDGSSLKIVDKAKVPVEPSSPDIRKNTLIGAAAGLFFVIALIVLFSVLDVRINSESDLKSVSDIPILGVISNFQTAGKSGYGYTSRPGSQSEMPNE